jgi:serralysin
MPLYTGTNKKDSIYGGSGNDTILGLEDDDTLEGDIGDDSLDGGSGNDYIDGEPGADTIFGGDGNDTIWGGAGNDSVDGGTGNDSIYGGSGNDYLNGNAGDDYIQGTDGSDTIYGGSGNDTLHKYLTSGSSYLDGGIGDDTIWGGKGNDTIIGGDGNDSWLEGYAGDDSISGGNGNDKLYGEEGNDTLDGGDGNDYLSGGNGTDTIFGGNGNDTLTNFDSKSADKLYGEKGNDILYGGLSNDLLDGGDGDDDVLGFEGDDSLTGASGNDSLYGGLGNDILDGGDGVDELYGAEGNDTYYVRDRYDFISDTSGIDTAYVSASFVKIPTSIEKVVFTDGAQALPYWIDALIYDRASGNNFDILLGTSNTFNYVFPTSLPSYYEANSDDSKSFTPFTTQQITRTETALAYVSTLIDVTFRKTNETSSLNTISFASNRQSDSAAYAYAPNSTFIGSDIFLDLDSSNTTLSDGTYGALTLIHELGHALGMKHVGTSSGASATLPYLTAAEDTTNWTVMSYNDNSNQYYFKYSELDIAALQYLYGPSKTARSSNDTYKISLSSPNFIWDGNGLDSLDISHVNQGSTVYLTPGYWGFVGTTKNATITSAGQITVNFGTLIENLIGSSFSDNLYGNEAANIISAGSGNDLIEGWSGNDFLYGEAGDDELTGGEGNDSIDGGVGLDTATFKLPFLNYSIKYVASTQNYTITATSGLEGTDDLINIENLKFSDRTVSIQSLGLTKPSYTLTTQKASYDEGSSAIFNLNTLNVSAGTSLTYTISGLTSADLTSGMLTGTTVVGADGKSTITIGIGSDKLTEGAETLTVSILGNSASATINDTSIYKGPAASDLVYVFKSEKTGPAVNPASYSYYYTSNLDEVKHINSQANWPWVQKASTFEAAHSNPTLSTPVFKFWSDKLQAPYFTISTAERDQIISWSATGKNGYDWKYAGTGFSVYTSSAPTDDLGKSAIPIFCVWMDDTDFNPANGLSGGVLFTADKVEYDGLLKLVGVTGVGTVFYGEVPGN